VRRSDLDIGVSSGRRPAVSGDNGRRRGSETKASSTQIHLVLPHSAAAPYDGRCADGGSILGARDPVQGIGRHVQEIGEAGGPQGAGVHEDAVFGNHVESVQQAMQCHRGLARAARAHQQDGAAVQGDAGSVHRHQSLATAREREYRELDELVSGVV
jgi:hypothetical protein